MFGLSFSHIILLSALALIFIGPKQLPEVARQLGKFLNELKRVGSDFSKTIVEARNTTDEELRNSAPPAPIVNPEPIVYVDPTIHSAPKEDEKKDAPIADEAKAKHD